MDRFDEVFSVLTEDQGWSEENARKIMVYCAEQGMNPLEASARFIGGMAGLPTVDMRKSFFNPWNMFPKKPQPQKGLPKPESSRLPTRALPPSTVDSVVSKPQKPQPVQAPKPAFSSVGTTTVKRPQGPQQPAAPAPQWGGSPQAQDIKRLNQLTKGPIGDKTIAKPVVSSGRMGQIQGPPLSTNVAPKPQFATSMGQAPKPAFNASSAVKGALNPRTLGGKLGFAGMALGAVDQAQKVFNPKDNLFTSIKDLATSIRHGGKVGPGHSRYRAPESDPALPRTPKPQPVQKAVEPVKSEPVKREAPKLSAAAKDFDKTFAAKRAELKKQGKDPNSGVFTWRGKQYNTKLK
jgi:hypothetical protein